MVRGRGYLKSLKDLEDIAVGTGGGGTPIYLRDVARVQFGPEIRRGLADLDGRGEVVAGIVVVRFGENVLNVIDRVKTKIAESVQPSLPKGVQVVVTYDRSDHIHRAIDTLREEIVKLAIAVSVVCLVFLFHRHHPSDPVCQREQGVLPGGFAPVRAGGDQQRTGCQEYREHESVSVSRFIAGGVDCARACEHVVNG
jgi:hypothetical protein